MQYFLAFSGYSSKAPFDPSMMVFTFVSGYQDKTCARIQNWGGSPLEKNSGGGGQKARGKEMAG